MILQILNYLTTQQEGGIFGAENEFMFLALFQILITVVSSIALIYLYVLMVKYLRLRIREFKSNKE